MLRAALIAISGLAIAGCSSPAEKAETPETEVDGAGGVTVDGPTETAAQLASDEVLAKYIPWDANAEGVVTTDSGLQYIVVSEGPEDGLQPGPRDRVTVYYDGRLTDGQRFDSSYARDTTASFGVDGVIAGWTEGLQYMSEGDEFIFYIPSEIGYGQNPRPGGLIKPGDDLIFRVELEKVTPAPKPREVDTEAWAKYTPWDSALDGVNKTDSGMEYVVLAEGNPAGIPPRPQDLAVVFYEGRFADTGEVFDSAFQRNEPALYPAGQFIPGWVEALSMMKPGDRWLVHLPPSLAYGPMGNGPIPPNATLNFEIELMDVVPQE